MSLADIDVFGLMTCYHWTQTDRYVPCLDQCRYFASLYLDHFDECGLDLGTRHLPWTSYDVAKEQDIALFIGPKIACAISVFSLEICSNLIIKYF